MTVEAAPPADCRRASARRRWRIAFPFAAGLAILLVPTPAGLAPYAWRYFALFTTVILAVITEPIPLPAVGLIGVTAAAALGLPFSPSQMADPAFRFPAEALRWALGGFVNGTVWLVFGAFVFATGYEKTGLGRRIALVLVEKLGRRTLGLGYAIALSDLALAPFTPSNTARSAGAIFPIVSRIPELYGSSADRSPRRIGAFLMWVAFATTSVTSSMFVTGLAPNLLALQVVRSAAGFDISWSDWFVSFLPIGLPLVALLPWMVYRIYPPEIKTSAECPQWAAEELAKLGRLTRHETIMAGLVAGSLALWIFGGRVIDPAMVALLGISVMLLSGVVSWSDISGNAAGWNVLVWFATLVVLSDGLTKVGVIGWISRGASSALAGYSPILVMVMLVALYFALHYMFASLTAHATALLPVMLAAGLSVPGMPARPFAMLMMFSLGLMGVLTPYATGPAPVYFGAGYISRKDFWRLGLIFGLLFLAALLLIGVPFLLHRESQP